MKKIRFIQSAAALVLVSALSASAQMITTSFNFDSVPSGSTSSLFNTSNFSFHQAQYVPFTDSFGDVITGTEHWEIDALNDALFPVTAENPLDYGRGLAPSGVNALQALFQPIIIQFDRSYRLGSFSATLDNDPFGAVEKIAFITAGSTVAEQWVDEAIPGLTVSNSGGFEISGIVLPAGAFYDDIKISVSAVPEPSTYGLLGAAFALGLATYRRRKRA